MRSVVQPQAFGRGFRCERQVSGPQFGAHGAHEKRDPPLFGWRAALSVCLYSNQMSEAIW